MKRFQKNLHGIPQHDRRKGAIMIFACMMLTIVIGFAAFTVDFGLVTLTKSQMQNAADSAAHAGALEVMRAFGPGGELSQQAAEDLARSSAVDMISRFRTGDVNSSVADTVRDVRVGRRTWSEIDEQWVDEWDVGPYNMVEVTVRRTSADTTAIPMTFAQVLGQDNFDLTVTSVAALQPGGGFYLPPGTPTSDTIDILPIALDLPSWNNLLDEVYGTNTGSSEGTSNFSDNYQWDSIGSEVNDQGTDGIPEINIYPDLNSGLAPGNRGTVDIGHAGNSTSDLKRQIVYGINAYDMSFFPDNKLEFDTNGALYLNGDTGISAGIQSSLQQIVGQVRAIPIFISVSGNGNNATYTIVKFVGVRIMGVKLSGGPKKRHLTVQPAVFSDSHVIRGDLSVNVDSILSQPTTVR